MKKFLLLCSATFALLLNANAQVTNITVELFYTDDGTVPGYPAGYSTYRIYANTTHPTDVVASVYGQSNAPFSLQVSGNGIWNSPLGGSTADDISCALIGTNPSLQYDSYVTFTKTCLNDPGQVRLTPDAYIDTDPTSFAWLDPYFGTAPSAGSVSMVINDYVGEAWFAVPGVDVNAVAGADNKILLAQITTDGGICGIWNLQTFPEYTGPTPTAPVAPFLYQVQLPFGTPNCGPAGCTDPTALNFNPAAGFNNGRCLYPCDLTLTGVQGINPSCGNLSDGEIIFTASGAQDLLSYTLNGGPNSLAYTTGDSITGLAAGTYQMVVRDTRFSNVIYNPGLQYSCSFTTTVTLVANSVAFTQESSTPVACFGDVNGCISATAAGGVGVLSYQILDGQGNYVQATGGGNLQLASASFCGLGQGTYTFQATDGSGCSYNSAPIVVASPAQLVLSAGTETDAVCPDGSNGSIIINYTGGTGAVGFNNVNNGTYPIAGVAGSATISGLPGDYTIYAQDANGCQASIPIAIGGPEPFVISHVITGPSCIGDSNATLFVSATGGSGSLLFNFNNGPFGATASWSSLGAGQYTIGVQDQNNCTGSTIITVNDPAPLAITATVDDITCPGLSNGRIVVGVQGGVLIYHYSLDGVNFQTLPVFNNLAAGTYDIHVQDGNGCEGSLIGVTTVTAPQPLVATATSTPITCFGYANGIVTVQVTGGTQPYIYSYGGNAFTTNNVSSGYAPGTVTITVLDANQCPVNATATITQPEAITITGLGPDPIDETPGGSSNYTVTGGSGSYTYTWTNANGSVVSQGQNLGPFTSPANQGSYTLTVTDANGCSSSQTILITGVGEIDQIIALGITPNPTMSDFRVNLEGLAGDKLTIEVTDLSGRLVVRRELGNSTGYRSERFDAANWADGVYFVKVNIGKVNKTLKLVKQ
jgi:hypothetical protein